MLLFLKAKYLNIYFKINYIDDRIKYCRIVEKNPITKLSNNYNNKLLNKINNFNN